MKKTLIIIILVALYFGVNPALSVPAAPHILTLEQADGSTFEAKLWGDENSHGTETIDGYTIVLDETTKEWNYATIEADGKLGDSKNSVKKASKPVGVQKHIRPTAKGKSISKSIKAPAAFGKVVSTGSSPVRTANIPVILINFADRTPTFNAANFSNLLFGSGVKSMKDYYEQVSYGAFTVSAGPSGVAGWYTASKGHDYYGTNIPYGDDRWPGTLVREAVAAADATFNFTPYDSNGDCYVDVVDIVHQGSGEEAGGPATDIWSHSWDLNSANYYGYSNGGIYTTNDACTSGGFVKINSYVIQPETLWGGQQTMGVFAHEYGHALGAPDLYDTDYSSDGIGDWSLMAGGSWNGIIQWGDTPAQMDAWTKSLLGWVTPKIITENNLTQIKQVETNSEVYRLLTGSAEYFLVENRQKVGFDEALPGQGLLIWHIDETRSNNANELRKLVDLEEADGLNHLDIYSDGNSGDANDPWLNNIIGFTPSSKPNSNLYNGIDSGVRVTDISGSSSIMSAYFTISPPPLAPSITVKSPNGGENWLAGSTKNITWSYTGTAGTSVNISLYKGGSLNRTLASGISIGIGTYSWIIDPATIGGSDYQINITSDLGVTDSSNGSFTISTPPKASITVVSPNGGENWQRGKTKAIRWTFSGNPGSNVTIELLYNGAYVRTIASSTANSGSYNWNIPSSLTRGNYYKIRVASYTNPAINDTSNKYFRIS